MKQKNTPGTTSYARYTSIALQLGVFLGISAFGGRMLDKYLECKYPIFLGIFSLLGIVLGIYWMIKKLLADVNCEITEGKMITIHKFGGSVLRDADSIRHMVEIINNYIKPRPLKKDSECRPNQLTCDVSELESPISDYPIIVVSATGTTTRQLLNVFQHRNSQESENILNKIIVKHQLIRSELGISSDNNTDHIIQTHKSFTEAQFLSLGEQLSSLIVSDYLNSVGIPCQLIDATQCIITKDSSVSASVDKKLTRDRIREKLLPHIGKKILVVPGFISATITGVSTTLGFEGSDLTAALLAEALHYKHPSITVTLWKDVPGIMNIDPKHHSDAKLYEYIHCDELQELCQQGAKVVHHKAMEHLKPNKIPMYIKGFISPESGGTKILY